MNTISIMRDYEHDLILSCEKAYNELSIMYLTKSCDEYLTESVSPYNMLLSNFFEEYMKKIRKTIRESRDNFSTIVSSINGEEITEFFTNIRSGVPSDTQMSIGMMSTTDIGVIRPEYLKDFFKYSGRYIQSLYLDEKDINSMSYERFKDSDHINKIKRQIVKLSGTIKDEKTLLQQPILLDFNETVIISNILPFMAQYQRRAKSLIDECANIEDVIKQTSITMRGILDAVGAKDIPTPKKSKINAKINDMLRSYLDLVGYISILIIRKMTAVTFNLTSILNLNNRLLSRFPEGDRLLHENAIDGLIGDIDDFDMLNSIKYNGLSAIYPAVDRTIERARIGSVEDNLDSNNVNIFSNILTDIDVDYDSSDYDEMRKPFELIHENINKFIDSIISGTIFDDAIVAAGLDVSFVDKYADVADRLSDVDEYSDERSIIDNKNTLARVFKDLNSFKSNCGKISDVIKASEDKFIEAEDMLRDAAESSYMDLDISTTSCNEAIQFLSQIKNDFNNLVLLYAKALISRLTALNDILVNSNDNIIQVDVMVGYPDDNLDYMEHAFGTTLAEENLYYKSINSNIVEEFAMVVEELETGIINIYEAGEPNSVVASISGFINDLLEKWKLKYSKFAAKNNPWLQQNKEALLNLDTNKIGSLTLTPYFDLRNDALNNMIGADLRTVQNSMNKITVQNIYQYNSSNIRGLLFSFLKIDDVSNISTLLKNRYMFNLKDVPPQKKIAGTKLSGEISEMINFCEGYHQAITTMEQSIKQFSDNMTNKCKTLETNAVNKPSIPTPVPGNTAVVNPVPAAPKKVAKAPSIKAAPKAVVTTSSAHSFSDKYFKLFTEVAEGSNKIEKPKVEKMGGNKVDDNSPKSTSSVDSSAVLRAIKSDSKTFIAAILTAYESRYSYYMNTLRSLIASSKGV